jgi:protein-disulfide isomerase
VLVDEYVRTGKVRIVFRGLAFLGPDSVRALRVTVAAGRQNRLWNVVEGLYSRQGVENSGWVTDVMLHEVAGHRAVVGSSTPWVDRELTKAAAAAQAAGIAGTPAFQVGRTGGPLELVQVDSLGPDGLRPAIESALAG